MPLEIVHTLNHCAMSFFESHVPVPVRIFGICNAFLDFLMRMLLKHQKWMLS